MRIQGLSEASINIAPFVDVLLVLLLLILMMGGELHLVLPKSRCREFLSLRS